MEVQLLLVQAQRRCHMITRVANDMPVEHRAVAQSGGVRAIGSARELEKSPNTVPANGTIEVARTRTQSATERHPREGLYIAMLKREDIQQDQAIWLLATHWELALSKS
jgi:hypothetical protein